MKVRRFAACALVALLVPAAAVAAPGSEVDGPMTIGGKGFFGGELRMELGDAQRPVRIVGKLGYVGFLDLGGDLKVRCVGRGRMATRDTEQGRVYLCKGRAGQALVSGSHFKLRGFAKRYRIHVPEGASGTLHTRRGADRPQRDGERGGERDANASVPSVAEVAAELAAAAGE